jgi:outer membrane receptor for ferrienterochelin and colicin
MKTLQKIKSLVLACLILSCPVIAYTQSLADRIVTLPVQRSQIIDILQTLEKNEDINFSYAANFPVHALLSLSSGKATVREILTQIREQTGFASSIRNNKVIFIPPAKKVTISGFLRDQDTGENLIGANVYAAALQAGTTTNTYGYYSLTLPEDSVRIAFSYVGYQTKVVSFLAARDTLLNIGLSMQQLAEVVIRADKEMSVQNRVQMGVSEVSMQDVKALPAFLGEVDLMKALQYLPGVQSGSEASSGLYVRGGSPDQNLILLDGVPVYNVSHLFGFFSVFNSDAINHVSLIKGGFPAQYGGRISSVVDIQMKEGNQQKMQGEASIGLLSSKLTLEGPLKKDKTSFIVSGRRSYLDLLMNPLSDNTDGYNFHDFNAKVNHRFNDRNRLYLSMYAGRDKLYSRSKESGAAGQSNRSFDLHWANLTTALRWNSVITPKLFSNVSLTYGQYKFIIRQKINQTANGTNESSSFNLLSGIHDFSAKADVDYLPSASHQVKTGIYATRHRFKPGAAVYSSSDQGDLNTGSPPVPAWELGAYALDEITVTDALAVNAGVHFSLFNVQGQTFTSLQPRLSARYLLTSQLSAKASYAYMQQYIHLLSNSTIGLPSDLWVPATARIRPEDSHQVSFGLAYATPNDLYEITLEGYHKMMNGVLEYRDGASFADPKSVWEDKVEAGTGRSYGTELLIRRKQGKVTGWISYTLAWSLRKFDNINFGKEFPFRYDRRHDLETVLVYKPSDRVNLSATWTYGSGYAMSMPLQSYQAIRNPGEPVAVLEDFGSRNNYRMSPFHKLDLSASFIKKKKTTERSWVISIYNAYNRLNAFYIGLDTDSKGDRHLYKYGLFPILPSIAYNIKF